GGLGPRGQRRGPIGRVFGGFNRGFAAATAGYIRISSLVIRRSVFALAFLALVAVTAFLVARRLPATFLPQEDQGDASAALQLPNAASLQRSDAVARKIEEILKRTPGVEAYTTVLG